VGNVRELIERWLPESSGNRPEALFRLAAGSPRRIGEMAADIREWHADTVQEALTESHRTGEKVGEELVGGGHVAPEAVEGALGLRAQLPVRPVAGRDARHLPLAPRRLRQRHLSGV